MISCTFNSTEKLFSNHFYISQCLQTRLPQPSCRNGTIVLALHTCRSGAWRHPVGPARPSARRRHVEKFRHCMYSTVYSSVEVKIIHCVDVCYKYSYQYNTSNSLQYFNYYNNTTFIIVKNHNSHYTLTAIPYFLLSF